LNVLLTGAGGFIGSRLYDALKDRHRVTRIFSDKQCAETADCYSVNLASQKSVESLVETLAKAQFECDAVIHLASRIASPGNSENLTILHDNISITESLSFIVKVFTPELLINFSSMAVYPDKSGEFCETSLPRPQENNDCIYGLSKFSSEVLFDYLLRDIQIRVVHLRVAQVYGDGMREDRIIPVMQKEIEETNSITLYDDGSRESCFIEVGKLVEIIGYFIGNQTVNGIWNVGWENLSYLELAKTVISRYGDSSSRIEKQSTKSARRFNLSLVKLKQFMR